MHRLALAILFISCCASVAAAQSDDKPRAEFFGGYSLLRTDYKARQPTPLAPVIVFVRGDQTLNGFNVSATAYLTRGFGLTGDFSGHFKTNRRADPLGGNIEDRIRVFNLLGGPQYKFRNGSRAAPFVHALAGVTHTGARLSVPSLRTSENKSSTDFALAVGGGLDIRVSERVTLRAIQIDYNPVFVRGNFGGNNELGFGGTANNVRLSFGVVFR